MVVSFGVAWQPAGTALFSGTIHATCIGNLGGSPLSMNKSTYHLSPSKIECVKYIEKWARYKRCLVPAEHLRAQFMVWPVRIVNVEGSSTRIHFISIRIS